MGRGEPVVGADARVGLTAVHTYFFSVKDDTHKERIIDGRLSSRAE